MLFFKRILKFDPVTVEKREQRNALRYKVEPNTPLRATLQMRLLNQSVKLVNLSIAGAAVQYNRPTELKTGDHFSLRIDLGRQTLRLDGTIAHVLAETARTKLGLKFEFVNFDEKKAYLQMLEPVAIGASMRPVNASAVHFREEGLIRIQYEGEHASLLTVWRKFAGQALEGFEFRMAGYCVRNSTTPKTLDVYTYEEPSHELKQGYGAPELKRVTAEGAEIRQLFSWVVPHLSSAVPDDVREYLAEFCK